MRRVPFSVRMTLRLATVTIAVALLAGGLLRAAAVDEYQVKAAYLYNFAKFVEWPAEAFESPDAPLIVGVYGTDPFGATLDNLLRDKRVSGRPFQVRRSSRMQDLRQSHIIFVGEGREPMAAVLAALSGTSALTVGQSSDFLTSGGIVLFQIEDGRVVFMIDASAASKAHLVISSQLLRLARLNGGGEALTVASLHILLHAGCGSRGHHRAVIVDGFGQ